MENKIINELNAVLKGENMAIEIYEKFIAELKNSAVKKEFQVIQQEHKNHATELAGRIQSLGGEPEYGTGMAGVAAKVKYSIEDILGNRSDLDILKEAYDGEDKGIAMVEEIVKGDLDTDSMALVKKILKVDHEHLKRMKSLILSQENVH